MSRTLQPRGKIISVRGSVVDVRFKSDLPSIYTVLHAGASRETSIEVLSQLNHRKPTLPALIREHLFVSLSKACAESLASENASRLAALQRAEKNIDELLDDLPVHFIG